MSNMADLNFNANEVDPSAGFGLIPRGDYDAVIVSSERKATKSGDGFYLSLTFQIIAGEFQNRKLWSNLNLWNKNEQATQIARGDLSAICRSVGVLTVKDSSELHNKPLKISLAIKKNKQSDEDENRIVGYKARHAGPATATAAPTAAPAAAPAASPWG
jgi:hypothetical protein